MPLELVVCKYEHGITQQRAEIAEKQHALLARFNDSQQEMSSGML